MPKSHASTAPERIASWIERVAMFFAEHFGLPPITGRVVGWLLICEPAEQSAGEIAAAIHASRASLTTAMRFLLASGLVRRLTRPGSRTTYYRIDDEIWRTIVERRIASLTSFSRITLDGMALVGRGSPRAKRLLAAHRFFDWMAMLLKNSPGPAASGPSDRGGVGR